MVKANEQLLLGARVPATLKEQLLKYCLSHGIKMNYFVTEAIKEKLQEIAEDNHFAVVARERLRKSEFITQKNINRYLSKRKIKL